MQSLAFKVTTAKRRNYKLFYDSDSEQLNKKRNEFLLNVESLSNYLLQFSKKRALLVIDDPKFFAIALVSCWQKSIIPVVTADLQSGNIKELLGDIDLILYDKDEYYQKSLTSLYVPEILQKIDKNFQKLFSNPIYKGDELALELFTSGSTGSRKRIIKSFTPLFEEVFALEDAFGKNVSGLPRLSMVSHFHIYGFLFSILWPLCTTLEFGTARILYFEELLPRIDDRGACIIASPATLGFLPYFLNERNDLFDREKIAKNKIVIFSSGGPLDDSISYSIENAETEPPVQVLGSTETGGIAYRTVYKGCESPYKPFKGVDIKIDDNSRLLVKSLCAENHGNDFVETGDLAEFKTGDAFILLGRFDKIVKVAGKRVSIKEMEALIQEESAIIKAKIFQFSGIEDNKRDALYVLAITDKDELNKINEQRTYKNAFVKRVKSRLKTRFDPIVFPRYWRFLDEFPVDSQGKTTYTIAREFFKS